MTDYNPNMQGRTCAVMVNTQSIRNTLQKMADIITNKSYQVLDAKTGQPMIMEDVTIMALLQETVNHYLEFILTAPSKNNITFEYYVQEYFQAYSNVLLADTTAMNYLNIWFATVCSQMAVALQEGVSDLHHHGYEVETIHTYNVDRSNHMYVLEGNNYGNDVADDPLCHNLALTVPDLHFG